MNDNISNDTFLAEAIATEVGISNELATKLVDFLRDEGYVDYAVVAEGIRD
jgi:hypothetical protein